MITFEVNVICDGCQEDKLSTPPAAQADKGKALIMALNSGWTLRQEKILCPKCSTKS